MPMEVVYAQCLLKKCCAQYWSEEANGGKMSKEKAAAIGQAVDEVFQIELMAPGTKLDARKGTQFQVDIPTPAPGWYTVLSKVLPLFEDP